MLREVGQVKAFLVEQTSLFPGAQVVSEHTANGFCRDCVNQLASGIAGRDSRYSDVNRLGIVTAGTPQALAAVKSSRTGAAGFPFLFRLSLQGAIDHFLAELAFY